jgi:hypothetical protein
MKMKLIHNDINTSISEMENIVRKGVPFAKRNKDRRIRKVLRDMRSRQTVPPQFKDIRFYFKIWITNYIKSILKTKE